MLCHLALETMGVSGLWSPTTVYHTSATKTQLHVSHILTLKISVLGITHILKKFPFLKRN